MQKKSSLGNKLGLDTGAVVRINKAKYKKAIKRCKELLATIDRSRDEFCRLTLEIVPVKQGSKAYGVYTYGAMCKDIGIDESTLRKWRRAYVTVRSKLPENVKIQKDAVIIREMAKKADLKKMNRKQITTAYEFEIAKVKKKKARTKSISQDQLNIERAISRLKDAHFIVMKQYKNSLADFKKKDIEAIFRLADEIGCHAFLSIVLKGSEK